MSKYEMIEKALKIAVQYGGIDGEHHKNWVIDQMVRALTDCPVQTYSTPSGKTWERQGENEEYKKLVANAKSGEDGPDTYSWEVGIPP